MSHLLTQLRTGREVELESREFYDEEDGGPFVQTRARLQKAGNSNGPSDLLGDTD